MDGFAFDAGEINRVVECTDDTMVAVWKQRINYGEKTIGNITYP